MKQLKTGDPCPCCGQPIQTKDPDKLYLLNWIVKHGQIPFAREDRIETEEEDHGAEE